MKNSVHCELLVSVKRQLTGTCLYWVAGVGWNLSFFKNCERERKRERAGRREGERRGRMGEWESGREGERESGREGERERGRERERERGSIVSVVASTTLCHRAKSKRRPNRRTTPQNES